MTAPTRRDLKRAIEDLARDAVDVTAAHTLVAPSNALPDEDPEPEPDVPTEAVTVADEETGASVHVAPLHSKQAATDGIPITTDYELRRLWGGLTDEQRARECRLRQRHDLPIPPLLQSDTSRGLDDLDDGAFR